mgnify:CR=1 FL=1
MKELKFSKEYITTYSFINPAGWMRPAGIGDMMQDLACVHAGNLGISDGCFWVMIRADMAFSRPIGVGERLIGTTWCQDIIGPSFLRGFSFDSPAGRVAAAVTAWVMIDRETGRILRPSVLKNYRSYVHRELTEMRPPEKLTAFGETVCRTHRVSYSDLDFNGHLNNVKIMEIVCDALMTVPRDGQFLSELSLNYAKQSRYDEELTLKKTERKDSLVSAYAADGQLRFTAAAKWKKL